MAKRPSDDELAGEFGPPGSLPEPTESDREVAAFAAAQRRDTRRGALKLAGQGLACAALGMVALWVCGRIGDQYGRVPVYLLAGGWGFTGVGAIVIVSAAIVWLRTLWKR